MLSSITDPMVVSDYYATTGANEGTANAEANAFFTRLTTFARISSLGFARIETSTCLYI